MISPLRVLHLEDNPNDATLIEATLKAEGIPCAINCVQSHAAFEAALEQGGVDLILSDSSQRSFDGSSASETVRARWPAIPLIFVSGTLCEGVAIDSLKEGATDYVLKDRLSRLGPVVRRAMLEVEGRAERQRLEARIVESQKMEMIGQLAGGVAHDFNNMLSVIMSYSDLITLDLPSGGPLRKYFEEIRHASQRAARLTQQLLIFSRRQTVKPVVLDLDGVVQDLDSMLRRVIDEHIEMKIVLGTGIGGILADSGYIGQVLMNLVVNARDAMPNGGKLHIATSYVTVDTAHPGALPGEYVMLSVRDTGTGLTDEVKARLFEPFFTTKPLGKGTGLGLATCQMIVQQSRGYIVVDSAVGQGSTFKIYFPRVEQKPVVVARPRQNAPFPRGTETLLVVEDDPALKHVAETILQAQGYTVLSASNGQEALQVARDHQGPTIRLVVTDVVMPLMGGKAMAESLKTAYPDLKILFTSGYMDDTIAFHGVLGEGVEFLPKPYTLVTLTGKVRELLDR